MYVGVLANASRDEVADEYAFDYMDECRGQLEASPNRLELCGAAFVVQGYTSKRAEDRYRWNNLLAVVIRQGEPRYPERAYMDGAATRERFSRGTCYGTGYGH